MAEKVTPDPKIARSLTSTSLESSSTSVVPEPPAEEVRCNLSHRLDVAAVEGEGWDIRKSFFPYLYYICLYLPAFTILYYS